MSKKYEVQHHTVCDGWVNVWHEYDDNHDQVPLTFDSFEEALEELDQHLYECDRAFQYGDLATTENRNDYRIVESK